jgi:hypothetical protein
MTTTTTNGQGAPFNEENTPFNGEETFIDGLEKLAGILTGVAEKLDALAEMEDDAEEMNASRTEDEAEEMDASEAEDETGYEDVFAALKNLNLFTGNEQSLAMFTDPLVKALDSMSDILEDATEKIMDMVFDDQSDSE